LEQTPQAHPQERIQVQLQLQPTPEKAPQLSITLAVRRFPVREARETSATVAHECRGFRFPVETTLCPFPVLARLLSQQLLAAPMLPEKPAMESP